MTTKPSPSESVFLEAARVFDEELASYHRAVEATLRAPLRAAKQVERAGLLLTQVAQAEDRLGVASQALSRAISSAHEQQSTVAELVQEQARLIAKRTAEFEQLMMGYRALGEAAAVLNTELVEIVQRRKELGDQTAGTDLPGEIATMLDKLSSVAETAQLLLDTARTTDFEDIARQVDSLRQQLLSARNKLALVGRNMLS